MLLRLSHPLLPEIRASRWTESGLELSVTGPVGQPVQGERPPGESAGLTLEILALAGFLQFSGLGIAPEDAVAAGLSKGGDSIVLPRNPVPAWRATPPGLLAAAVLLRLSGVELLETSTNGTLRRSVEAGLRSCRRDQILTLGARLLALEQENRPVAALLRDVLSSRPEIPVCPSSFLGTLLPASSRVVEPGERLYSLVTEGGLELLQAIARSRPMEADMVELRGAFPLRSPSLRDALRSVTGGDRRLEEDSACGPGRPLILVACDFESWDPACRQEWDSLIRGSRVLAGLELRTRPPLPWESSLEVRAEAVRGEISNLFWLPFSSVHEAAEFWPALSERCGGDLGRGLRLLKRAARAGPPYQLPPPSTNLEADVESVVLRLSVLPDGFSVSEAIAAAAATPVFVEEALATAQETGILVHEQGEWRFSSPAIRQQYMRKLTLAKRETVVSRIKAAGVAHWRWCLAGMRALVPLPGGEPEREFSSAVRQEQKDIAIALLAEAADTNPGLGDPVAAILVLSGSERIDLARRLAQSFDPARQEVEQGSLWPLARALSRFSMTEKALVLASRLPGAAGRVLRARILLESHQEDRVAELLGGLDDAEARHPQWRLIQAELSARRKDFERARRELTFAPGELEMVPEDAALDASFSCGFLASDTGDAARAAGFFRHAREMAQNPVRQAEAGIDLGVCLLHGGEPEAALAEFEKAMAFFSQARDSERYVLALANRAEVHLFCGRLEVARADLAAVLAHDGKPGREFQYLFSVPGMQEIYLASLNFEAAGKLFEDAWKKRVRFPRHDASREILLFEAQRLLIMRDPERALGWLEEAAAIPDNRMQNEPRLLRLRASALLDLGKKILVAEADEFFPLEKQLAKGEHLRQEYAMLFEKALFEKALRPGREPVRLAVRIIEWCSRFPGALEHPGSRFLLDFGVRAAAAAGLPEARHFFLSRLSLGERRPGPAHAPRIEGPSHVEEDAATKNAFQLLRKVARSSLPVLILGETGTGKEIAAREVHRLSGRTGSFIPVNVAALPETLVESELFGHARGAFTGADKDKEGLLELASGGTLFLDEIGELPQALQPKLLRALQEKEIRRVGETKPRKVEMRLISATNRDLQPLSAAGLFRADLYYRLAGLVVSLPPLRERPRDLTMLIRSLLPKGTAVTPRALAVLKGHNWPGNIRELMSVLELAVNMAAPGFEIDVEHLPLAIRKKEPAPPDSPSPGRFFAAIEAVKRREILGALADALGNRTRAAQFLGISRQALLYEMRKLRID